MSRYASGRRPPETRRGASGRGAHTRARSHARAGAQERKGLPGFVRLIIVVLTVVILGALAFFIGRYFDGSWAAKEAINASISAVEESDEIVVALNNTVSATVDDATNADTQSLISNIESGTDALERATKSLNEANELREFFDDNQQSICEALRESIDARQVLLSSGKEIISVDARVGEARGYLEQAIEKALAADEKSKEATTAANEYAQYLTGSTTVSVTDANVAVNLDNEVITLVEEAKGQIASAKEVFGEADYSLYETYLEKRAQAAQLMLEADTALVSGDFQGAGEKTNQYNEADTAAAEAAAALPASTIEIFSEPYANLTKESRAKYTQAAAKVAEADALIRHFQGVSVATVGSTGSATTQSASTQAATTSALTTDIKNDTSESATSGADAALSANSVVAVQ